MIFGEKQIYLSDEHFYINAPFRIVGAKLNANFFGPVRYHLYFCEIIFNVKNHGDGAFLKRGPNNSKYANVKRQNVETVAISTRWFIWNCLKMYRSFRWKERLCLVQKANCCSEYVTLLLIRTTALNEIKSNN